MNNFHDDTPPSVQHDINDAKQLFLREDVVESIDPGYNRMMENLEEVVKQHNDIHKTTDYLFNQGEFVDALEHVVADQLSALKKEKLTPMQWSERFNRWTTFCDAVVNLGFSCLYSKEALSSEEYDKVFSTLALNKVFETSFLKPRGIRVILSHKSAMVKEKYPWLAMPCLVVKDEQGVEHEIAITPSPNAEVWWLDILMSFHSSYNWNFMAEQAMEDEIAASSIDDPYAPINQEDQDEDINPEFLAEINKPEENLEDKISYKVTSETKPNGDYVFGMSPVNNSDDVEIKGIHLKGSPVPAANKCEGSCGVCHGDTHGKENTPDEINKPAEPEKYLVVDVPFKRSKQDEIIEEVDSPVSATSMYEGDPRDRSGHTAPEIEIYDVRGTDEMIQDLREKIASSDAPVVPKPSFLKRLFSAIGKWFGF